MTDAERSRLCYWSNAEYRERKKAQARAWNEANRDLMLERQRERRQTAAAKKARKLEWWSDKMLRDWQF